MTNCQACDQPIGKSTYSVMGSRGKLDYCSERCLAERHPQTAKLYGFSGPSADELLDRALVPVQDIRYYICEQEGYEVTVLRDGNAIYRFDNGNQMPVTHLTEGHINSYLASGYWKTA